jgi:2-oxoacid:acceptor oxidoreductase delta subunit (pyruvate/2-ketoisovalerate family)
MDKPRKDERPDYKTWKDIPLTPVCNFTTIKGNLTGSWRTFRPVVDMDKCIKCGICWQDCPDAAIEWDEDHPVWRYSHCKGCGICARECPSDAIEMELEVKI